MVRLTEHIISNNRIENEKKSIQGAKRGAVARRCGGRRGRGEDELDPGTLTFHPANGAMTLAREDDGTLTRRNPDTLPAGPPKVRYCSRLPVVSVNLIDPSLRALEVQSDILALISPPSP